MCWRSFHQRWFTGIACVPRLLAPYFAGLLMWHDAAAQNTIRPIPEDTPGIHFFLDDDVDELPDEVKEELKRLGIEFDNYGQRSNHEKSNDGRNGSRNGNGGDNDSIPKIPEPLVFDLVRPLGARRGEVEVNTLALFPLGSLRVRQPPETDPFGLTPLSLDRRRVEWAPEIEFAVMDGFALEFELPFEGHRLEAYKLALQYTFGTAFENRFIHGTQSIIQPTVDFDELDLTLLYLFGIRFDDYWSILAMFGGRTAVRGSEFDDRTEILANVTIFRDITDQITVGVENNLARDLRGRGTLLLLPQIHLEPSPYCEFQFGLGAGFTPEEVIPTAAVRVIFNN